jgi:CHRD domain
MKALPVILAVAAIVTLPAIVRAERIEAKLIGYQEVPSVSTPAAGEFRAKISADEQTIDYELTFSGLVGTVQQSHIHFGQRGVNGSVVIWLCQTATTPAPAAVAALTPFCPQSGTVTGTITAANVVAASTASQQITAGELDEVIAAIRAGVAYANVHATPLNPGGEIRGQIRAADEHRRDR